MGSTRASFIHIVDLDGAVVGYSVNDDVIKEIIQTVTIPVKLVAGSVP